MAELLDRLRSLIVLYCLTPLAVLWGVINLVAYLTGWGVRKTEDPDGSAAEDLKPEDGESGRV